MLWLPWTTATYFYPRSPCGERPVFGGTWIWKSKFLSTLSLRRATNTVKNYRRVTIHISIHALLAESDSPNPVCIMIAIIISIHALLAESDN